MCYLSTERKEMLGWSKDYPSLALENTFDCRGYQGRGKKIQRIEGCIYRIRESRETVFEGRKLKPVFSGNNNSAQRRSSQVRIAKSQETYITLYRANDRWIFLVCLIKVVYSKMRATEQNLND